MIQHRCGNIFEGSDKYKSKQEKKKITQRKYLKYQKRQEKYIPSYCTDKKSICFMLGENACFIYVEVNFIKKLKESALYKIT